MSIEIQKAKFFINIRKIKDNADEISRLAEYILMGIGGVDMNYKEIRKLIKEIERIINI